jgi:hypothetical protein
MAYEGRANERDGKQFSSCSTCGSYGTRVCCPPLIVLAFQATDAALEADSVIKTETAVGNLLSCARLDLLASGECGGLVQ